MTRRRIRAVSYAVAALAPLWTLTGCGDSEGKSGEDDAKQEPSAESGEPTTASAEPSGPAFGEKIQADLSTYVTLDEPQLGTGQRLDVYVTATNESSLSDGAIDLFLSCAGNYNIGEVVLDADTPQPALPSSTVPALETIEGYVSLTLPLFEGAVVESCMPDTVSLVVPGFAGQDVVYPIAEELAEGLLAG